MGVPQGFRSESRSESRGRHRSASDPENHSSHSAAVQAVVDAKDAPWPRTGTTLQRRRWRGSLSEGIGPNLWPIAREVLRGVLGGLRAVPADQRAQIHAKLANVGVLDAVDFAEGYVPAFFVGLADGVVDLVKAAITLVTAPYHLQRFLIEKLPDLAVKYGPRLLRFLSESAHLTARLTNALLEITSHPLESLQAFDTLLQRAKGAAVAEIHALGHGATASLVAFFAQSDWETIGAGVGKVVGRVAFEVLLAVLSEGIVTALKEALSVGARLAARAFESALELFQTLGRLLGRALEWVSKLAGQMTGHLGRAFKEVESFLQGFRVLIEDLAAERLLAETGTGLRVPVPAAAPKGPTVLEARGLKAAGGGRPTPLELIPEKVHPSSAPLETAAQAKTEAGQVTHAKKADAEARSAAIKGRDEMAPRPDDTPVDAPTTALQDIAPGGVPHTPPAGFERPLGPKPPRGTAEGTAFRYQRYKHQWSKRPEPKPPLMSEQEYAAANFQGGRAGGPLQRSTRTELAKAEGYTNTETTQLGVREVNGQPIRNMVDMVKPGGATRRGTRYVEVDPMSKRGLPSADMRAKLKAEINALKPNEDLMFVDSNNPSRRIIYEAGEDATVVDTRTAATRPRRPPRKVIP
jgi:hypothetical protein